MVVLKRNLRWIEAFPIWDNRAYTPQSSLNLTFLWSMIDLFYLRFCFLAHNLILRIFKEKGRISKRVSQENKARQIFRKTNISYPLIRTRFEIRPSALLSTKSPSFFDEILFITKVLFLLCKVFLQNEPLEIMVSCNMIYFRCCLKHMALLN